MRAAGWYLNAVRQGYALAQYKLAVMQEEGTGIRKDVTQASIWYHKAAKQGNVDAKRRLKALSRKWI